LSHSVWQTNGTYDYNSHILAAYAQWWNADTELPAPNFPQGRALYVGWEAVTPSGERFQAGMPAFDFAGGRVEWRCSGLADDANPAG
jgi:hypothetical protein